MQLGRLRDQNGKPVGVLIKISSARLQEVLPQLFEHKVVLTFAGACASTQAKSWIRAFNENSITQLSLIESLVNSLYVVTVEERTGGKTRAELAAEDHHKADGRFATINLYESAFDPQNPLEFKYLVTIRIWKGTLDIYALLDDILRHVGKVADRDILTGNRHHMITILVSTTCREFAHDAYAELEKSKILHVELEYYEPYLRCFKCFTPDHSAKSCSYQPKLRITPVALFA